MNLYIQTFPPVFVGVIALGGKLTLPKKNTFSIGVELKFLQRDKNVG